MCISSKALQIVDTIRSKGFDQILKKVNIKTLKDGKLTADLKLDEEHLNSMGGLHGGLSATLVDSLSSFALLTHENGGVPSVSVDISISYMKGAKLGDDIEICANTIRAGRTLAFLEVSIENKTTGDTMVKASHTKFLFHNK